MARGGALGFHAIPSPFASKENDEPKEKAASRPKYNNFIRFGMDQKGPSASAERGSTHHKSYWERRIYQVNTTQRPKEESKLFANLVFYFNGRVGSCGSYRLGKLVQKHGGNITPMLSMRTTTHLVCNNLSGSKTHEMLRRAGPGFKLRIVKPEWILDSIKEQKLLRVDDYLVVRHEGSERLDSLGFATAKHTVADNNKTV